MSKPPICIDCGKGFVRTKSLYAKQCGKCAYERQRVMKLTYKYDITQEQYHEMYAEQNGCCKICGIHESRCAKRLHVDHCHDTGRVRGLLCAKCNTSIGQFEREPDRLLRAYDYLTRGESDQ